MRASRFIPFLGMAVLLAAMTTCKTEPQNDLTKEEREWVENTLKSMSAEEKLGQLLAPAIAPPKSESDLSKIEQVTEWINKYHIGHVSITGSWLDPELTARFINDIQGKSEVPVLMHTDLETGLGGRFDGGTILPPFMGLAQTRSEELVYKAAAITAKEARAVGLHLINSPVLDVNINSRNPVICIRSFGDNPDLVTILGKAYVRGLNDNGLIGAAKHFPGHGDVAIDSHTRMPVITACRERLDSVEFLPYKEIIPAGLKAIMTAHISIPAIDPTPGLPATMSKPILTGVLRDELGFDGLIITDAFDMGGILESGSFEESALRSFLAGNDIVLLWTDPRLELVFPHMLKAIEDGRISGSQLDVSVRRVLNAKALAGLHKEKLVNLEKISLSVNTPEHSDIAREIHEKSVILVKNNRDILPLPYQGKKIALLSLNDDREHLKIGEPFINEMRSRGNVISVFRADPETPEVELRKAMSEAQNSEIIVVGLFARIFARRGSSSLMNEQLIRALEDLSNGDTPVFVVSFGSPYLISDFPGVDGYMVSTEPTWNFYGYDRFRPGQVAAARALFGESDITGRLAVTIPELFPFGHGITFSTSTINNP